jgi:hypothetical protein
MTAAIPPIRTDWRPIKDGMKRNRNWLRLILIIYGVGMAYVLGRAIHDGHYWRAGWCILLVSPLLVFFTSWLWQDRGHWRVDGKNQFVLQFDPHKASWAFMADIFAVAPAMMCFAKAFPLLPRNSIFTGTWWWVLAIVCLALGGVAAASFRSGEVDRFDWLRYYAYIKMMHNGVAFTILFGSGIWLAVMMVYSYIITGLSTASGWLTAAVSLLLLV